MLALITGGSGSGKSQFAEDLTYSYSKENLIYIATMDPFGEESIKKIEKHKKMRSSKNFSVIECYTNLNGIKIENNMTILLDCISNLLANEMYNEDGCKENVVENVLNGVNRLIKLSSHLIIVTNEIFSDGISYSEETTRYLKNLAKINLEIGKIADTVVEVVYSIPIYLKGGE